MAMGEQIIRSVTDFPRGISFFFIFILLLLRIFCCVLLILSVGLTLFPVEMPRFFMIF